MNTFSSSTENLRNESRFSGRICLLFACPHFELLISVNITVRGWVGGTYVDSDATASSLFSGLLEILTALTRPIAGFTDMV